MAPEVENETNWSQAERKMVQICEIILLMGSLDFEDLPNLLFAQGYVATIESAAWTGD